MILERQTELLILSHILSNASWKNTFEFAGEKYDKLQILERYKNLMIEFLEPYALNSKLKS